MITYQTCKDIVFDLEGRQLFHDFCLNYTYIRCVFNHLKINSDCL